ncbi:MAG: McrC family protein [Chitinivibrionia bacterium]|nr:McrC family protein [Chitinivibrionia bacterium]
MSKPTKIITIREFDEILRENDDKTSFSALENFILSNKNNSETDTLELLKLSAKKGVGKVISAKNYVGIITLKNGTTIEILPKIANLDDDNDTTKKIFLKMLKTLKNSPFKEFNTSNLKTEKFTLLEIFIKMFLDKVSLLTRQGLKSAYVETEENESFYKGKLLVSQNIRHNLANKERFFVRFDEFSINRPENKLIKSTLKYLLGQTRTQTNQNEITKLLTHFELVDFSNNYDTDFSKVSTNRSMKNYSELINCCKIFLKGNSFTAFSGSETAIALLFPMEKIFESYVAALFRKYLPQDFTIYTQDSGYYLFEENKKFRLKPDIVITSPKGEKIILDTKWKLLSLNENNYGISQADMYQMYAYGKKYGAKKVILLYPNPNFDIEKEITYTANDDVKVEVLFVNLKHVPLEISKTLLFFAVYS